MGSLQPTPCWWLRTGSAESARRRRPLRSTTSTRRATCGRCSASTATAGSASSRTIGTSSTWRPSTLSTTACDRPSRRCRTPRTRDRGGQPPGGAAGRVAATPGNAALDTRHEHAQHRANQRVTPAGAGGRGGWVNESWGGRSGFSPAYLDRVGSSFTAFLATAAPDLLPGRRPIPQLPVGDATPHGTTIVAATYDGGVLMGGDRRATMGNLIPSRDIEKVYPADSYSAIGIAGAAGIAIEMVRLYQVELEHYEKIEGITLSLDGKANRLAQMIRGNLGAALQGLAVVPLFAGFDLDAAPGT